MSEAAFSIPDEDRDIFEVARLHDLHIREFMGKTILNLGSGSGNLQADLDEEGIHATVISLDINAAALQEAAARPTTNRLVVADAAHLPLRDESIDLAISTYGLPLWARNPDQLVRFFDECKRVIKVGGMLAIYPMYINVDEHYHSPDSADNWHVLDFIKAVEADELSRSPDWDRRTRNPHALLYHRSRKTIRHPHPGM